MRKSLFITGLLLVFSLRSYSQVPPNLMVRNANVIDSVMKTIGGSFKLKDYTDTGKPVITYEIDYSLIKKRNSQGNSLYIALFVLAVQNRCTTATYMYADKSDLAAIVDQLDSDNSYTRKTESFGWESNKYNYDINIDLDRDSGVFSLTYFWLPSIRKK